MSQKWADASTSNCVWLFQVKCSATNGEHGCACDVEYCEDSGRTIGKCTCFVDYWETQRVFLLREEARDHGKRRPYAWGKENEGWRIYGVACDGVMLDLLSTAGVTQEFIDARKKPDGDSNNER